MVDPPLERQGIVVNPVTPKFRSDRDRFRQHKQRPARKTSNTCTDRAEKIKPPHQPDKLPTTQDSISARPSPAPTTPLSTNKKSAGNFYPPGIRKKESWEIPPAAQGGIGLRAAAWIAPARDRPTS